MRGRSGDDRGGLTGAVSTGIRASKRALRAAALAARARWGDPVAGGEAIGAYLEPLIPEEAAVAGVWPLPGEIDLRPLLRRLHTRGNTVLLPETPPRGQELRFRRWTPDCAMIPERFGTLRPDGESAVPDVLLVPFLAFDRRGYRLGYGGGYYDRTLAARPGRLALGFGWAAQEVAAVPREAHDVPLPVIATEAGVIRAGARG